MQVDLAAAEPQRGAAGAERHRRHAQHPGVEVHRGVDTGHGEHHVIEPVDPHAVSLRRRRAMTEHPIRRLIR
jgi:hypothetical protein